MIYLPGLRPGLLTFIPFKIVLSTTRFGKYFHRDFNSFIPFTFAHDSAFNFAGDFGRQVPFPTLLADTSGNVPENIKFPFIAIIEFIAPFLHLAPAEGTIREIVLFIWHFSFWSLR
jgi:hypothetical protein